MKNIAGKVTALVGRSGSGKSTVIALLERFYHPTAGEITLDGVCIRSLDLNWWRCRIGLVSQEPTLLSSSIRQNILYGNERASMADIIAAAKLADAHDFIQRLPNGYDTQVCCDRHPPNMQGKTFCRLVNWVRKSQGVRNSVLQSQEPS
ncbi:putative multidrug resistance protein [Selaginella moellendorffii]|uniref:putative multidrug resistance protein n=1 Tax=Selaginella moellendorffii TaxID=88036 RepID=UPI000D1C9991|nr:putative multidrug resistance protein [Selaginella moellendorffii]|eukprot:XP_024531416.1 putative multidrug resistance protein [Selaginella moellendorffii]